MLNFKPRVDNKINSFRVLDKVNIINVLLFRWQRVYDLNSQMTYHNVDKVENSVNLTSHL